MNHPIFTGDTGVLVGRVLQGKVTAHGVNSLIDGWREPEKIKRALKNLFFAKLNIASNGFSIISAKSEKWDSEISRKTLENLLIKDIKFPFDAVAIEIEMGTVFFSKSPKFIILSLPFKDGNRLTMSIPLTVLGQKISDIGKELSGGSSSQGIQDVFYSVISILLYTSFFKKQTERVSPEKIIVSKGSKKKGIPRHQMNVISLRQSEDASIYATAREEIRTKSTKSWIVRGHWRNQFYKKESNYKPKWIDPYWKGSGKDVISKTYRIS